jgi:hypothetical protein
MTTRILVPLDGSALAERALPCAQLLAQSLPANLVLFRAVSISPDFEVLGHVLRDVEAHMKRLEAGASEYLRQVAERLKGSGLSVRTVVRRGPGLFPADGHPKDRHCHPRLQRCQPVAAWKRGRTRVAVGQRSGTHGVCKRRRRHIRRADDLPTHPRAAGRLDQGRASLAAGCLGRSGARRRDRPVPGADCPRYRIIRYWLVCAFGRHF